MDWAVCDIQIAMDSPLETDQVRHRANAMMNARRAVSCLVDQYLLRDGFARCKNPPRRTATKVDLLVRRGVLDSVERGALDTAASQRHLLEHKYQPPDLALAQANVQLIRATLESVVARSDPSWSPAMAGTFMSGWGYSPAGYTFNFDRWNGPIFFLMVLVNDPWVGVLVPSSNLEAILRRVRLRQVSSAELAETLAVVGSGRDSAKGMNYFTAFLQFMNVND